MDYRLELITKVASIIQENITPDYLEKRLSSFKPREDFVLHGHLWNRLNKRVALPFQGPAIGDVDAGNLKTVRMTASSENIKHRSHEHDELYKKLSGKEKEIANKLINAHEHAESIHLGGPRRGPHSDPVVIEKERRLYSKMGEKYPKLNALHESFRKPEAESVIGITEHGSHRKEILNKMEQGFENYKHIYETVGEGLAKNFMPNPKTQRMFMYRDLVEKKRSLSPAWVSAYKKMLLKFR